jgi:hypothetical protein
MLSLCFLSSDRYDLTAAGYDKQQRQGERFRSKQEREVFQFHCPQSPDAIPYCRHGVVGGAATVAGA